MLQRACMHTVTGNGTPNEPASFCCNKRFKVLLQSTRNAFTKSSEKLKIEWFRNSYKYDESSVTFSTIYLKLNQQEKIFISIIFQTCFCVALNQPIFKRKQIKFNGSLTLLRSSIAYEKLTPFFLKCFPYFTEDGIHLHTLEFWFACWVIF